MPKLYKFRRKIYKIKKYREKINMNNNSAKTKILIGLKQRILIIHQFLFNNNYKKSGTRVNREKNKKNSKYNKNWNSKKRRENRERNKKKQELGQMNKKRREN